MPPPRPEFVPSGSAVALSGPSFGSDSPLRMGLRLVHAARPRAARVLTAPKPAAMSRPGLLMSAAVLVSRSRTCSADNSGYLARTSVAAPETCGAANDVPVPRAKRLPGYGPRTLSPAATSEIHGPLFE